jgi:hypothetical protein
MRSRKLLLGAGAVAAAVLCGTAFSAHADEEPPPGTAAIDQVTPIVIDHNHPLVARASFRYVCSAVGDTPPHLFVAAKQGPFINTTDRSSSDWARAFYDTNWKSDKGGNALNCDGATHRIVVTMLPDPSFSAHHGVQRLEAGKKAFLQICLFDDSGLSTNYTMKNVFVGR